MHCCAEAELLSHFRSHFVVSPCTSSALKFRQGRQLRIPGAPAHRCRKHSRLPRPSASLAGSQHRVPAGQAYPQQCTLSQQGRLCCGTFQLTRSHTLRVARDHRPAAGQQASDQHRVKVRGRASSNPGAALRKVVDRSQKSSKPIKPVPGQPQPLDPRTEPTELSRYQAATTEPLLQHQHLQQQSQQTQRDGLSKPAADKAATSSRQAANACSACGGRGFRIVEEELQPCSACNDTKASGTKEQLSRTSPMLKEEQAVNATKASPGNGKAKGAARHRESATGSGTGAVAASQSATEAQQTPKTGKGSGRSKTEAEKAKISATKTGRTLSEYHRQSMRTPKVCSFCGESGHNRLGCPSLHGGQAPVESYKHLKGPKVCSYCGEAGHNRAGCHKLYPEKIPPPPKRAFSKDRAPSTCSYCGQQGHSIRFCKVKQQDEADHGPLWGLAGVEEQKIPGSKDKALAWPMPVQIGEAVSQASAAVSRAHEAGVKRQKLELLLPQAGATSSQGSWPGGIRQQAQFAVPRLIEPLLKELKQQEAFQGRMTAEWLDESDCVGAWQNERLAAVMFPTADTLTQVRNLAKLKGPQRPILVINPQWQTGGQIVSDFGFGQARTDADKFLAGLQDVYCLERVNLLGDDIRLLKCYPGHWQVHYTWPNGKGFMLIGLEQKRPTYARLRELLDLVPNTRSSRSWVDKVLNKGELGSRSEQDVGAEAGPVRAKARAPLIRGPPKLNPAAAEPPAAQDPARPSLRERVQTLTEQQQELHDEKTQQPPPAQQASSSSQSTAEELRLQQRGNTVKLRPSVLPAKASQDRREAAATLGSKGSRASGSASLDADGLGAGAGPTGQHPVQPSQQPKPSSLQGRPRPDADSLQVGSGSEQQALESDDPLTAYIAARKAVAQDSSKSPLGVNEPSEGYSRGPQGPAKSSEGASKASLTSRSFDGDDDGMLDRFGTVDIVTGRRVRDLKLDPVLQLRQWRESIFGSRESVSESIDKVDSSDS